MKRCLMLLLPVILLLAGCGHAPQENESLESMTAPMTADHSQWQQEPYYILQFNVDSVISNAPNVTATASRVIISQGGTYLLSGTLQDAQLTVEIPAGETARLVLCGVDMHCERGPVIYSNGGGTVVLLLENGTENTLSDGKSYLYSGSKVREAAISVEGDCSSPAGAAFRWRPSTMTPCAAKAPWSLRRALWRSPPGGTDWLPGRSCRSAADSFPSPAAAPAFRPVPPNPGRAA